MLFKTMLAKQFRKPWGLLGLWAIRFMEKNNQDYYTKVVELLEVQATDSILEIGFGTGLAIKQITARNAKCSVTGLDFSSLMHKKAQRNNLAAIEQKRVQLILGDLGTYDFGKKVFTKVFGINVIYFWGNLPDMFGKLYSVLRPGGKLVLFMSSPERLNQIPLAVNTVFHKYPLDHVQAELKRAGFSKVTHEVVPKQGQETYYLKAEK